MLVWGWVCCYYLTELFWSGKPLSKNLLVEVGYAVFDNHKIGPLLLAYWVLRGYVIVELV